jgi:AcrR family transcriptional regulator
VTRRYELKQRATSQAETRQQIVDAAVALHGSVGPARTTISAIAERAGVQRLTVYRHFPDERTLFQACSSHWATLHPRPDPVDWASLEDPEQRLRVALGEIYAYFQATEAMSGNIRRDLPQLPVLQEVAAPFARHWEAVRKTLDHGWKTRGRKRALVRAVIGHAIEFETWRSLVRHQGLDKNEAIELMLRLVRATQA